MAENVNVEKILKDFELVAKCANDAYILNGETYALKTSTTNPLPIGEAINNIENSEIDSIYSALGRPENKSEHQDIKKLNAYLKLHGITKGEKIGQGSRAVALKIPASKEYPNGAVLRISPADEKKRIDDNSVLQPYYSSDREGISLGSIKAEILPAVFPADKAAELAAKLSLGAKAENPDLLAKRTKELKSAVLAVFLTKNSQENPNIVDTDMTSNNLYIGPTKDGKTLIGNLDATGMKHKDNIINNFRSVEAGEKKFLKIKNITEELILPLTTNLPVTFDQKMLNDKSPEKNKLFAEAKKQLEQKQQKSNVPVINKIKTIKSERSN